MADKKEEKDDFTSAYNEGLLQIRRLADLWDKCAQHSSSGRLKEWRWTLGAIWRELSRDAAKIEGARIKDIDTWDENYELFKKRKELDHVITVHFVIGERTKNYAKAYRSLEKMQIFLHTLQEEAGKGSKFQDTSEDMEMF
jgi:hypothetical protein